MVIFLTLMAQVNQLPELQQCTKQPSPFPFEYLVISIEYDKRVEPFTQEACDEKGEFGEEDTQFGS